MGQVLSRALVLAAVAALAVVGPAPSAAATTATTAETAPMTAAPGAPTGAPAGTLVADPCDPGTAGPAGPSPDPGAGTGQVCPYLVEVAPRHAVRDVTRDLPAAAVTHVYGAALHGFAARLRPVQAAALRHNPHVLSVSPDSILTVADSQANPPWGLDRIDSRGLPLSGTYEHVANGGAGVRAYVIDTGIRATHRDFGGRVAPGASFVTTDTNGTDDCIGHGTHVAGTIGGATYGVAKAVTLVPLRVLGCNGSGYDSWAIAALEWVIADHAAGQPAVANLSLGGKLSPALNAAIANTVADGVVVAVAAGNDNVDACSGSPASAPEALTVGATDSSDRRAPFSSYGPCLDLFAPGVGVLSAGIASDTATATMNGTSMAAPHVTGIAAVAFGLHPTASAPAIIAAILGDATPGVLAGVGAGSPNLLVHTPDGTPPTAVLTAPASPTRAAEIVYTAAFSEAVTGLGASDFAITGTATGCVVGTPALRSAASYDVVVGGCSDGTVVLSLEARSVADAAGNAGPPAPVAAAPVTVDRATPTTSLACSPGPGPTNATSLSCTATFDDAPGPGSSFTADDVLLGGSATGWAATEPVGAGAGPYAFSVAGAGADGTLSVAVRAGAVTDGAGNPTAASATLAWTIDRTFPSTGAPAAVPRAGAVLSGSAIPMTLTWSGADGTAGSGVARYELAVSRNGGAWTTISTSLTSRSAGVAAAPSGTIRYRVRAVDAAGNVGAWTYGRTMSPRLIQQSSRAVRYARSWSSASSVRFSGGSLRYTGVTGRSASYTFSGRSIALVTTTGPSRGAVRVYVGGRYMATVSLYRSATAYRAVAWQKTWSSSATRTVKLVVVGTRGHPRVDLDAFVVVR